MATTLDWRLTMLYELRRYDVAPGKMPALLDRFGSFTVDRWKEYDFHLTGFWTPDMGVYSNQIVYMWAWESMAERERKWGAWREDPRRKAKWEESEKDGPLIIRTHNMLLEPTDFCQAEKGLPGWPSPDGRAPYLFELREYEATLNNVSNVVRRFRDFTSDRFAQHGFRQVGYWTPFVGGYNNQLIYMLAWESYEERAQKFGEFRKDPERARVFDESEKDGPIVGRVMNTMLRAAPFSPLR
jgi:hypothetical protein